MYRKFIWDWKGLAMNVTTFGKLSNNLVVVIVIIVTMLEIRGFAPRSFLALTMPFYTLRPLQNPLNSPKFPSRHLGDFP